VALAREQKNTNSLTSSISFGGNQPTIYYPKPICLESFLNHSPTGNSINQFLSVNPEIFTETDDYYGDFSGHSDIFFLFHGASLYWHLSLFDRILESKQTKNDAGRNARFDGG